MSLKKPRNKPQECRLCDRCGLPCDEECPVWRNTVCYPCFASWRLEAPTAGEIVSLHGGSWDKPFAEFYEPWTEAWVKRHPKAVAA